MIPNHFTNEDWAQNIVALRHNAQLECYFLEVNGHCENFETFGKAVARLIEVAPMLLRL